MSTTSNNIYTYQPPLNPTPPPPPSVALYKNERIRKWLGVSRLIDDIDNHQLLTKCINQISSVFGGNKQFLYFIARCCNIIQLENIYKIIKTNKLHHINNKKANEKKDIVDLTNDDGSVCDEEENKSKSYFLSLPNESISNICQYLNRLEIEAFKVTSKQIGIVCLEEQTKIKLAIFNTNDLINTHHLNLQKFIFESKIWHRYNAKNRFYSLFQEWMEKYNISEQYMLIFCFSSNFQRIELFNSNKMRLCPINSSQKNQFIICDGRRMVILNKSKARQWNGEQDNFESLKDYKLVILEYFDVMKQKTNIAQFIMCHQDVLYVDILRYIEHEFVLLDNMNNKWYIELEKDLKQMDVIPVPTDYDHEKLRIYTYSTYHTQNMALISNHQIGVHTFNIFQINNDHLLFNQSFNDKYHGIKQHINGFYSNALEFCINREISIYVKYIGRISKLKSIIMSKMQQQSECNNCIPDEVINTMDAANKGIMLMINRKAWSAKIRMEISRLFGGIIPALNIELFAHYGYLQPTVWNKPALSLYNGVTVKFDIVSYDTSKMQDDDRIYSVKIYEPKKGPYPCLLTYNDDINEIVTIKEKKRFPVKRFIKNVLSMNELKMNDERSYILSTYTINECIHYNGVQRENDVYSVADIFNINHDQSSLVTMDLFMVQSTNPDPTLNKLKLKIRFICNANHKFNITKFNTKTDVSTIDNINYIGLPLIVWVDKEDTLQNVMNKYIDHNVLQYVQFTYRVIIDDKIVSIGKSTRNKFKPYRFLKNNQNDFIVVTFSKIPDCAYWLPSFPQWVYKNY